MTLTLKDQRQVTIRLLQKTDAEKLFRYFLALSEETKSRFGPHQFDRGTVELICAHLPGNIKRYIAIDQNNNIVAYMLIRPGMLEGDRSRLLERNIYFDQQAIASFAPSVADDWQNSGLGSLMYDAIEKDIRESAFFRYLLLWGGVQAGNARAVHYYEKKGFEHLGNFYHNGKDNYDMIKRL